MESLTSYSLSSLSEDVTKEIYLYFTMDELKTLIEVNKRSNKIINCNNFLYMLSIVSGLPYNKKYKFIDMYSFSKIYKYDLTIFGIETNDMRVVKFNYKFLTESQMKKIVNLACKYNHLDAMKFLLLINPKDFVNINDQVKISITSEHITQACINGHLKIVKLLMSVSKYEVIENNIPITSEHVRLACINGHLKIVKLFIENNIQATSEHITEALKHGHLKIVKLLIQNNIPPTSEHITEALKQYLLRIGSVIVINFNTNSYLRIIKLLIENGASIYSKHITQIIAKYSPTSNEPWRIRTIKLLLKYNCPLDRNAVKDATYYGHLEIAKLLLKYQNNYIR